MESPISEARILHLADDSVLTNGAYDLFEKYYPGRNVFVVQTPKHSDALNYVIRPGVLALPLTTPAGLKRLRALVAAHKVSIVCVHYASPTKAAVAVQLSERFGVKLAWIFFGADLYEPLSRRGHYELYDKLLRKDSIDIAGWKQRILFMLLFRHTPESAFRKFVSGFDFFCFWNDRDFDLLTRHYRTRAAFRFFIYYSLIDRTPYELPVDLSGKTAVLVNHSSSYNGNHLTVLRRLKELAVKSRVIVPVSYGSGSVRNEVLAFQQSNPDLNLDILVNFLPMKEYYKLLESVGSAVFGHRRQEGAGNIFHLLSHGVKVFLRNDNNMLQWLREKGCVVFSFEDDLRSADSLEPLNYETALGNREIIQTIFSSVDERRHMESLFAPVG